MLNEKLLHRRQLLKQRMRLYLFEVLTGSHKRRSLPGDIQGLVQAPPANFALIFASFAAGFSKWLCQKYSNSSPRRLLISVTVSNLNFELAMFRERV